MRCQKNRPRTGIVEVYGMESLTALAVHPKVSLLLLSNNRLVIKLCSICTITVVSAAQTCGRELDEKMKGRENDNSKDTKCCMFAEYRRCVHSYAAVDCGPEASNVVDTVVRGIQSALSQDCEQYQYYSPTCITIIWFNYIVLGAIIFVILSVGCCLGSCCCRS